MVYFPSQLPKAFDSDNFPFGCFSDYCDDFTGKDKAGALEVSWGGAGYWLVFISMIPLIALAILGFVPKK